MLYCEQEYDLTYNINYKILIIEDSEFFSKAVYSILNKINEYEIEQAFNLKEASQKLQEQEYDFIILDLTLSDSFGEELVSEIKRLTKAKIIVLTAEADAQIREDLFKRGILDYIVKDKNFLSSVKSINNTIHAVSKNLNSTILVIDDSKFMCKQMQSILDIRNYITKIALNAEDGFKILNNTDINLVILDMELPDKHGLDLLREIKDKDEFCHIPIIILSGSNDPKLIRDSLKVGASDFVKKPFNIEEFTLKVDLSIDNNRKHIEVLCKQKILNEYKEAVDDSTIVSKTDTKGIITFVNDKFCEISGYTQKELIGQPHSIVRHPDMSASIFRDMWSTIQSKKSWSGKVQNLKKDGSSYYVQSTINPIVDYDGNIIEYMGIRTDITEIEAYKSTLENNLNISNNNLNHLSQYENSMGQFVAIIKTDTNNIITYVNDNFCTLSKFSENELLGKNCNELRAKKHIENGDCNKLNSKLLTKKVVHMQFENIAKDKTVYITDTKIFSITDINNNTIEYLHLMYDITEIIKVYEEIEHTQKEIIYKMGEIGESRSRETGNHVKRVAEYSRELALLSGLGEKNANLLYTASPMHDIGKVSIPDSILNKPGKLDASEWKIMQTHSEIGYRVLKDSKRPLLRAAAVVAYRHHEKWDGSGYPNGIAGEKIHIFGRITAVADVFDALGSDRPYKKAWELEKILIFLEEEKGKHFDPELIELFLENIDKFLVIRDKFQDI